MSKPTDFQRKVIYAIWDELDAWVATDGAMREPVSADGMFALLRKGERKLASGVAEAVENLRYAIAMLEE